MGCDWYFFIQELVERQDDQHGTIKQNEWKTILEVESKTRCGGRPISTALFHVYKEHGIHGDYGCEYKSADGRGADIETFREVECRREDVEWYNKNYTEEGKPKEEEKKNEENPPEKRQKQKSPTEVLGEKAAAIQELEECRASYQEGIIGCNNMILASGHCFFISTDQFKEVVVPEFEKGDEWVGKAEYVSATIIPCMEMLGEGATVPPGTYYWADDEKKFVASLKDDLKAFQEKKREEILPTMKKCVMEGLAVDEDLAAEITKFMPTPAARDIRLAIWDDEHNSKDARNGKKHHGNCTVM